MVQWFCILFDGKDLILNFFLKIILVLIIVVCIFSAH